MDCFHVMITCFECLETESMGDPFLSLVLKRNYYIFHILTKQFKPVPNIMIFKDFKTNSTCYFFIAKNEYLRRFTFVTKKLHTGYF